MIPATRRPLLTLLVATASALAIGLSIIPLHNSPLQLWATLGATGLLAGAFIPGALVRSTRSVPWNPERTAPAAWFGCSEPQAAEPKSNTTGYLFRFGRRTLVACFFALLGGPALLATGHPSPSSPPPNGTAEAIRLIKSTLTSNPDLEYAHYNLGRLLP